jgi:hypothetical protein
MTEIQPTTSSDTLSAEDFLTDYTAVEALIDEADEAGDEARLDLYEEKLASLEIENPRATQQLRRDRLNELDRKERRMLLKGAGSAIRARKRTSVN